MRNYILLIAVLLCVALLLSPILLAQDCDPGACGTNYCEKRCGYAPAYPPPPPTNYDDGGPCGSNGCWTKNCASECNPFEGGIGCCCPDHDWEDNVDNCIMELTGCPCAGW